MICEKICNLTHEVNIANDVDKLLDGPLGMQVLHVGLVHPESSFALEENLDSKV